MDIKIGITVVVLVLGVMWAGELAILSAQNSTGSETQQTQPPNETSEGKVSTETSRDPVTQQKQVPTDIIGKKTSTGIRIFGIHIEPTITLGTLLIVIVGFLSLIVALLVFIFGNKTRSKKPPELTSEEVSKPENANEVEEYIKAIDRNPKATLVEKAIAEAYVLQRSEKIEETIEKWRSIANVSEGHDKALAVRAWASVGFLYINKCMWKESLAAFNKALKLKPDFAEVYNGRAIVEFMFGNYEDALADCDKAIQLKPDYVETYNSRALVKQQLGRYQDALADCDEAIRLKPNYAGAYNNRFRTTAWALRYYQLE